MIRLLFALSLIFIMPTAHSQRKTAPRPPPEKPDAIDIFINNVIKEDHVPGVSLAIVKNGRIIKAKGYGLANVEHDVPVNSDTVFLLASITKSFTATGIMMLVEEGKIKLDEKISVYLPDTPPSWKEITVRRLLTHTAGLKDRFEGKTGGDWQLSFTKEEMYRSARATPVDFAPGEGFQYSDQGYFLLGKIIEEVCGKSYRQFIKERIFDPLGMDSSTTDSQREIIKHRAEGYTRAGGKLYHNHRRTEYGLVSHYGILSTAIDLAKFDAALYGEKLLKRSTLEQMWTSSQLSSGDRVMAGKWSYGFGWFVDRFFGHRLVQHGGSTGTAFWRMPDDQLTVIVLTNLEQLAGGDATGIAKLIASKYVPQLSWANHKPQPDRDPKLTQTLKAEIVRFSSGQTDPDLYVAKYGPAVAQAVKGQKTFYDRIGPLKSFDYLSSDVAGKDKSVYYRAVYKEMTLYYSISLNSEGKIAAVSGEPDISL